MSAIAGWDAGLATEVVHTAEPLVREFVTNAVQYAGAGSVSLAVCLDEDVLRILDGMAPHAWQGPTATEDWRRDVLTEGEHVGASGYQIVLGEPRHLDVTGEYAYVVAPATRTFDLQGRKVTQTGSVFTVALRKVDTEWRLTASAWAKGG